MSAPGLDYLFHPRSVAIVGIPSDPGDKQGGRFFLDALLEFGYEGSIYPVNPRAGETLGLRVYSDLMSVPEPLDYVICCLRASSTPQLLRDCAAKGVKSVAIYTAGFSEDSAEGGQLEQDLTRLARQLGVRLVGPNCLGLYCPGAKLSYSPLFSKEAGHVGLVCQTGGGSSDIVQLGMYRGIRFSKAVSYGNAADLDESDFIEYLAQDSDTKMIAAYVEGVRDGRRLAGALRQAAAAKPLILLKGGRTAGGAKAASSHTGAMAGRRESWDALLRQSGVMQVATPREMVDLMVAFRYLKPPRGRRVGIIGGGGGQSVMATDACEQAGLVVPAFSSGTVRQLEKLIPRTGSILRNPVDSFAPVGSRPLLLDTVKLVAASGEVDFLLMQMSITGVYPVESAMVEGWVKSIVEASKLVGVPVALVPSNGEVPWKSDLYLSANRWCVDGGVAMYHTLADAARAISAYVGYCDRAGRAE